MDILLAHSYFLDEDPVEQKIMKPYPPLGLLYLSAYLKARGFAPQIFDSTFKTRQDYYDVIDRERPSVVGIYCNLLTRRAVLDMARHAKARGATVVIGGPEPRYHADKFVENGADVVVAGEGELTLEELLPHLRKHGPKNMGHIKGITYREETGQVVSTGEREFVKSMDELPLPDRDAIDMAAYVNAWRSRHGMGSVSLITARGCPYKCSWCSRAVFGESHRRRSPHLVAEEVALIREKYNPDMLWMADDVFTINHRWLAEFHAEMKKRDLRIPFECISRADRLNDQALQALSELGCFRIWYGSESGSQKILDAMKRGVTVDKIREVTRQAKQYGIKAGFFVMFGYPGEELEDIEKTIAHLKLADPDDFLTTVAYPIKGTPFYEEIENRIIEPAPWEQRIDRALSVTGRHSYRFYQFVQQRAVNEFKFHKMRNGGEKNLLKMAEFFLKGQVARLGMELTKSVRT